MKVKDMIEFIESLAKKNKEIRYVHDIGLCLNIANCFVLVHKEPKETYPTVPVATDVVSEKYNKLLWNMRVRPKKHEMGGITLVELKENIKGLLSNDYIFLVEDVRIAVKYIRLIIKVLSFFKINEVIMSWVDGNSAVQFICRPGIEIIVMPMVYKQNKD